MTIRLAATTALALVLASAAGAQQLTGGATLGFGFGGSDGDDYKTTTLDVVVGTTLGNGVSVSFDGTLEKLDPENSDAVNLNSFALQGGYAAPNGLVLGGYVEATGGDSVATMFGDSTSYGLTGGWKGGAYEVQGFYGATDLNDISGVDARDYGVIFSLKPSSATTISGSLIRTRLSDSGDHTNANSFGLSGSHAISDRTMLFAGVTKTKFDEMDFDATSFGIGASFSLADMISFPLVAGVEYNHTNLSVGGFDSDFNALRLSLTVPFGGATSATPLNSTASRIERTRHSALTGVAFAAY